MNYKEYLSKWSNGIQDELVFWNNFIANEGGQFFWGFEKTTSSNRSPDFFRNLYEVLSSKEEKCASLTCAILKLLLAAVHICEPIAQAIKIVSVKLTIFEKNDSLFFL